MAVSFEDVKRMLGWCSNVNSNNYPILHNNLESSSSLTYSETNQPTLFPLLLKNTYVAGLRKETVIGLLFAFTVFVLYHISGYDSFFHKYGVELIIFSTVLTQFIISRSSVEINSKYIKVSTILQRILGSKTYTLDSINTVQVQKNKLYRLVYRGLFIVGIFWLFTLLSQTYAGETMEDLTRSFIWVVFCFGYGYIMYIGSKSVYHIRIRFNPHPSINHLMIHTKDAHHIADILKRANRHSDDLSRNYQPDTAGEVAAVCSGK
ncbi:MAG: hypothetical protein C5S40_06335 [ANME-2 cluster archaeon]|nr:hypothetical protein [ANME-2 cluster archaeon]